MITTAAAPPRLVIVGSTASGKSAVAFDVARRIATTAGRAAEIVCIDAMTVYRGMDIGTAKPTPAERATVMHHLLDLWDPTEESSLARVVGTARAVLRDLRERDAVAVLVGGTGLYVDTIVNEIELPGQYREVRAALEEELASQTITVSDLFARLAERDPLAASRMEPNNERRIVRALEVTIGSGRPFSSFGPGLQETREAAAAREPRTVMIGLARSRSSIAERIARRYGQQRADGFVDEAIDLWNAAQRGTLLSRTARQGLGYREIWDLLDATGGERPGEQLLDGVFLTAVNRTVAFAKRQERWFRRDPRIEWLDADAMPTAELADRCLARLEHWAP
jgi:tRNA dimethylallyltransferase